MKNGKVNINGKCGCSGSGAGSGHSGQPERWPGVGKGRTGGGGGQGGGDGEGGAGGEGGGGQEVGRCHGEDWTPGGGAGQGGEGLTYLIFSVCRFPQTWKMWRRKCMTLRQIR